MHLFSFLLIIPEMLPMNRMCSLSNQTNFAAHARVYQADQTVQTSPDSAKWMSLQDATIATGRSEKTLRRYIKKGELKAKRTGKLPNSPIHVYIDPAVFSEPADTDDGTSAIFEAEADIEDAIAVETDNFAPEEHASQATIELSEVQLKVVLETITKQFAKELGDQKDLILGLKSELEAKDKQIRLLPDLQKQLQEREALEKNIEFEKVALEKQIEALKLENNELKQKAEASQKKSWWRSLFSAGGENS